jgi:hypothetical protein
MTTDFRALLADDAYAASFQSLGQYRTALLKALATPPPEPPTDEAWQEFIEQVQRAQHVAIREGECPRFDLVECALAFWRETIPPAPAPEPPTDEELLKAVRHLYGDQTSANMGADDDLFIARAVLNLEAMKLYDKGYTQRPIV